MTTPNEFRRTTADTNKSKVLRVKGALLTPDMACLSNREIARQLQVDESMVRRWRKWASEFVSQARKPTKKDAGKKNGKKS